MWTKKLITIVIALLIPITVSATVFLSEDWETGTPAGCWPCKTESCTTTFRGWETDFPSSTATTADLSTTQNNTSGGTRSYYNYKAIGTTDGCPITYNLTSNPTTIYVRFYMYMTTNFNSFPSSTGDPLIHWIFTNSQQSSTGFRLNLTNRNHWGNCPAGDLCLLPEGQGGTDGWGTEWWENPGWTSTAADDYLQYVGSWNCFEYKMTIVGAKVELTEWINGVQKRGPVQGHGSNTAYFSKIIFHLYGQNYSPDSVLEYYLDDIVVSDEYIGPLSTPFRKLNNVTGVRVNLY